MSQLVPDRKPSGSGLGVFLARTLKKLRTDRGMSQEALAEKSGLDRTYISLLERNRKNVTLGTLEKIIPHISTNPVDFFATFSTAIGEDMFGMTVGTKPDGTKEMSSVGVTGLYCVRLLAQFSDWVASEIRQPMLRVRQSLSMLTQGGTPAPRLEDLESSVKEIERILSLLSIFSSAASSTGGTYIPVRTILESAAALAPSGSRGTTATIKVQPVSDSVTVKGHPAHLIFALLAVLNWVTSTDNVDGTAACTVSLEANDTPSKVQISVVNTNHELTDIQRSQVFLPSFMAASSKEHGPRNLGLCMAKGIFEEHFGSLWLDQGVRQTRFVMDLPKS